jgi:hypothetical protein
MMDITYWYLPTTHQLSALSSHYEAQQKKEEGAKRKAPKAKEIPRIASLLHAEEGQNSKLAKTTMTAPMANQQGSNL